MLVTVVQLIRGARGKTPIATKTSITVSTRSAECVIEKARS